MIKSISIIACLSLFALPAQAVTHLKCTDDPSGKSYYTVSIDASKKNIDMTAVDESQTFYRPVTNQVFGPTTITWITQVNSLVTFYWFLDRSSLKLKMATGASYGSISVGGSENVKAVYSCVKFIPKKNQV